MNVTTTVKPPMSVVQTQRDLRENWAWLMAFGVLSIVLGSIGMLLPALGMAFSATYYGAMLLAGGVFQLAIAFKHKAWKDTMSSMLMCVLYIIAGTVIMQNPSLTTMGATLLIGVLMLVMGSMRLIGAHWLRGSDGWSWSFYGGWMTVLLGFMVLAGWPVSAPWVIGTFVSVEVMINGWTATATALAAKNVSAY